MLIRPTNVLSPLIKSDMDLGVKKLSEIMLCNESTVRRVLRSEQPVPEKSIKNLSIYFKTNEEFWLKLNDNYRISKSTQPEKVMRFSGEIKNRFNVLNKLMGGHLSLQELMKKSLGNTKINMASIFIGVPRKTLSDLINNKTELSINMAFKLSYAFETNIEYWLNLKNENKINKKVELK